MKKITQILLVTLAFTLSVTKVIAQDGYTYTLQHNGGYSFTVQAVPNTSTNNFATSVQSYGFTLILPNGITIDTGSATSLAGSESASFFDGSAIGQATIDGYLVTETLGSPVSLPAPSAGINSDLYTFTVNGSPTSGTLYILENNSALASTITPLKSFMQADMIDNGMAQFANVVDPNAAAVSGMSSFTFSTLSSSNDSHLQVVSIYPNPTVDALNIKLSDTDLNEIEKISIYDLKGQLVLQQTEIVQEQQISVKHLSKGLYIIELNAGTAKHIKKFIKQ